MDKNTAVSFALYMIGAFGRDIIRYLYLAFPLECLVVVIMVMCFIALTWFQKS